MTFFHGTKIQEISNSTNVPWDWKKLALPTSTVTSLSAKNYLKILFIK